MTATVTSPTREQRPEQGAPAPKQRRGIGSIWRGRPGDPAWVRPALLFLLVGTGVMYIWGLDASGRRVAMMCGWEDFVAADAGPAAG